MYSFVAKEIDYANYFQTVRVHKVRLLKVCLRESWGEQGECGHGPEGPVAEHVTERVGI